MTGKGEKSKELLTRKTAAILSFLRENELGKAASKLQKYLEKDGFKFPDESEAIEGRWKWIEVEEESSSEEEESESDDESETEEESSEEEDESEEESEEDDDHVVKKKDSTSKKVRKDAERREVDEDMPNHEIAETKKKSVGRSVSFSDEIQERILSPHRDLKKQLFFSKTELRQFKMEAQEERLREQMAQASAAFGITLPVI